MFRTILVPLDGSDLAERAIPEAEKLVQASSGKLILLWVLPELSPVDKALTSSSWRLTEAVVSPARCWAALRPRWSSAPASPL